MRNAKQQVEASRTSFDAVLHTREYENIHHDDSHLEGLLGLVEVGEEASLLDLGTGGGYVAFEMARRWPRRRITGVDVASDAIAVNRAQAAEQKLGNVEFHVYEGVHLPFEDGRFDGVVCRYAFHHCPEPQVTVSEMSRVLNDDGVVVLSDPVPAPADEGGFIDAFQRLRPDGHHRFHRRRALVEMFAAEGLELVGGFKSSMTYPTNVDERHEALLNGTPKVLRDAYCIRLLDDRAIITVTVLNSLFRKRE